MESDFIGKIQWCYMREEKLEKEEKLKVDREWTQSVLPTSGREADKYIAGF